MTTPTEGFINGLTQKPPVTSAKISGSEKSADKESVAVTAGIPESALRDIGLHEQITAIHHRVGQRLLSDSTLTESDFYSIDKLEAHLSEIRHVAVSIFVFDGNKLLLQRRAESKYHSAGLWANTVCSHPRWQESADQCASRRLNEELGWAVPLFPFGAIDYSARVGDLFENEHVHCFYGRFNHLHDVSDFNTLEVGAVQWMSIPEILQAIQKRPEAFTEWFKIYMTEHRHMIESIV